MILAAMTIGFVCGWVTGMEQYRRFVRRLHAHESRMNGVKQDLTPDQPLG